MLRIFRFRVSVLFAGILLLAVMSFAQRSSAQQDATPCGQQKQVYDDAGILETLPATPITCPPDPYELIPHWGKIGGERKAFAVVLGMGVDSHDNLWAVMRCWGTHFPVGDHPYGDASLKYDPKTCPDWDKDPVVEIDSSGKFVKSWGKGMFVLPHGLYVDKQDHIWITDTGPFNGKGQQVFEFDEDGKLLMTLGTAGVSGDGQYTFNRPGDVAISPQSGNIYVADGHGADSNARVVEYTPEGKFIRTWGKKGSAPGEFNNPHVMVIAPKGQVLVGDRDNNRIQVFDQSGKLQEIWKQFGRPDDLAVDQNNNWLYASSDFINTMFLAGFPQGIRIGSLDDGVVKYFINTTQTPEPVEPTLEAVAVDSKGNIYQAQTFTPWVRKYALKTNAK